MKQLVCRFVVSDRVNQGNANKERIAAMLSSQKDQWAMMHGLIKHGVLHKPTVAHRPAETGPTALRLLCQTEDSWERILAALGLTEEDGAFQAKRSAKIHQLNLQAEGKASLDPANGELLWLMKECNRWPLPDALKAEGFTYDEETNCLKFVRAST